MCAQVFKRSAVVYEGCGLCVQGTCLFVLIGLLAVVYSSTTENDTTSAFQFICITVSTCLHADRWLARCVDAPDAIRIRSKYLYNRHTVSPRYVLPRSFSRRHTGSEYVQYFSVRVYSSPCLCCARGVPGFSSSQARQRALKLSHACARRSIQRCIVCVTSSAASCCYAPRKCECVRCPQRYLG